MTILVTGATGCLGSHIAHGLAARGGRVRLLLQPGEELRTVDVLRGIADSFETVRGDVRDSGAVGSAMNGCSAVFHLAGVTGLAGVDAAAMRAVNVDGTGNVAEHALRVGARMVHTSSASAVGLPVKCQPLADEDFDFYSTPVHHPYVLTKRAGEAEVFSRVERGLDAVILNPGPVLASGGDWRNTWSGLIVAVARGRFRLSVPGGIGIVGREQVVASHLAALEHGKRGRRYLVVEHNIALTDLITIVTREVGVAPPIATLPAWAVRAAVILAWPVVRAERAAGLPVAFAPEVLPFLIRPLYYDSARVQAELGLASQPVESIVAELADWCRTTGLISATARSVTSTQPRTARRHWSYR